MSFVLERIDDGLPVYFSLKVSRDFASPGGGWAREMKHALQFGRTTDVLQFARVYLKDLAPWCSAVPYAENQDG
jgi:hypothetical protein